MEYESGMMYDGSWKKGHWDGHGRLAYGKKDFYAGEFAKGYYWGHGLRHWQDGSKFEGDWKLGKMSGKGIFRNNAGDETDGSWEEDKLVGRGRVTFADGAFYEGILAHLSSYDWLFAGRLLGTDSKYRSRDGVEYKAVWVFADGNKFEGLFVSGKYAEYGDHLYRDRHGKEYRGCWKHHVELADGSEYYGMQDHGSGAPIGFGNRWYTDRRDEYEGE